MEDNVDNNLRNDARDFAVSTSEQYSAPSVFHIDIANDMRQSMSKSLGANKDIVYVATNLMDIALGECLIQGNVGKHTKLSSE